MDEISTSLHILDTLRNSALQTMLCLEIEITIFTNYAVDQLHLAQCNLCRPG